MPSQRQPRHPHSLSQFTGPRRFELTAQETFDFYRLRLKLIRQHLHGIALPGTARLQVIKVRCQGGRHKLRGDWFLPSAKSDIHRPTQVLGKLQGCAQTLRQQIQRSRFDNFVKRRVVCGTLIQQPFEIGSGILI